MHSRYARKSRSSDRRKREVFLRQSLVLLFSTQKEAVQAFCGVPYSFFFICSLSKCTRRTALHACRHFNIFQAGIRGAGSLSQGRLRDRSFEVRRAQSRVRSSFLRKDSLQA